MLKHNKIVLLLSGLGLVGNAYAVETPQSQVQETSSFYEDDAEFNQAAVGSEEGWGWQLKTSVSASIQCDTNSDCGGGGPIDPPPDVAPSVPKSIAVLRTKGSNSVEVKWQGGNAGRGSNFHYELRQQYKDQIPQDSETQTQTAPSSTVSVGNNLSSIQNPGADKIVKYAVRACNSVGCSPYKTSQYYSINANYDNGGAVTKPLESVRTNSQLARKGTYSALSTNQTEQETALAALSKGYDALKGEVYGNSCWDLSGAAQLDSVQYINDQKYSFSQVDTYESLATTLDVKRSGGGSISFGGFSIGGSGSSSLYSETSKVTESSVIVSSFIDKQNRYQAKQALTLGMSTPYVNYLVNNQPKEFRKFCGDKFIDTVTTGRKILFTIRVVSEKSSYSEIKSKTLELKASLESYSADGNFTSSEASSLEQEFEGYTFDIIGTQTGGSDSGNLLRLNSITEYMTVLTSFANSNDEDLVNIESTERDYPIPSALAGTSHFDVFSDYTEYRDILQTWGRLDSQLERRCWMLDLNGIDPDAVGQIEEAMGLSFYEGNVSQRDLCDSAKDMVDRFVNYCSNQGEWNKCFLPNSSNCIDSINNGLCMQRPELISFKGFRLEQVRLDLSKGGCLFRCYKSKSVQQCFTNTDIIPDFSRNAVITSSYSPSPVNGLVVTVDRSWNVSSASNSITKVNGNYCLKAKAEVFGKGGFGAGGRYESNNQMFGFQTQTLGYSL